MPRTAAIDGSPCAGRGDPVDGLASDAAALFPQLASRVAMLSGVMAAACGAVLAVRRLAGAIEDRPGPEAAIAACGAGLLLVAVGDFALRSMPARFPGATRSWLPAVLTRLGLLMAVTTVCLPFRFATAMDVIGTAAVLAVSLVAISRGPVAALVKASLFRHRPVTIGERFATPAVPPPSISLVPPAVPPVEPARELPPQSDGILFQRFERLVLPGGAECVRGRVCVEVPKGARSGYGHVGFCPPLASQPTVDVATDYDGVEAVVSAAEVLPWGVRIECRLDEPAEETIEIPVDILATTPA